MRLSCASSLTRWCGVWGLCLLVACESGATSERGARDAGSTVTDGGVADAGAVDAGPAVVERAQHATCRSPLPPILPPEPSIARDARGRPLFDLWRSLDCEEPSVADFPRCDDYAGQRGTACYTCAPGSALCQGVRPHVPTASCVPTVSSEPPCTSCVTLEAKRKACCLGEDAFCEAWPFRGAAKPGYPCAEHADCEAGLACVTLEPGFDTPDPPYGYGVCSCPGELFPTTECSPERVP